MTNTDLTADAVALMRAQEQVRQERETFDYQMKQGRRWALLRITMGWIAAASLPTVVFVCWWIVSREAWMPVRVKELATGALLIDVLGLVVWVWRGVVGSSPNAPVVPVTSGAVRGAETSGLGDGPR